MANHEMKRYNNPENGSALILVLLGIIILSLLGITSLNQSSTDMVISRNFTADKTAFFSAEDGVNRGLNLLKTVGYGFQLDYHEGNASYRTGPLVDNYGYPITSPQPVGIIDLGFHAPIPGGSSVENINPPDFIDLTVSSYVSGMTRGTVQKEVQAIFISYFGPPTNPTGGSSGGSGGSGGTTTGYGNSTYQDF
jgi:hypothetical protein